MFNVHDSFGDISEDNLHREGYFRSLLHQQYHFKGVCQSLKNVYHDIWNVWATGLKIDDYPSVNRSLANHVFSCMLMKVSFFKYAQWNVTGENMRKHKIRSLLTGQVCTLN